VTFHVEHRELQAHKILLAGLPRRVLRLHDGGGHAHCVRILDMKADAFEAVLRFVYTDETPPDVRNLLDTDCSTAADKARLTGRVRDLLAVADRFGLERVRLMCERVLCEAMDEENAAAALSLADRHHCQKLKAFCIHYISSTPGALKNVMATEAFQELKESRPSILTELLHKLATKATCP
jgi:speckle-type POZ protein